MSIQQYYPGKAFISCSLRKQDEPFVKIVEKIVESHFLIPFGTVGRYSAAPTNTAELMRQNIPEADIIVIAATGRYFQQDLHTGQSSSGLSEMLHVESGIAYAYNKPIIVFVEKGVTVGNFLPNITQYIVLDNTQENLSQQWALINTLFTNAINMAQQSKDAENTRQFQNLVTGSFAVLGVYKLIEYLAIDSTPRRKPKRKPILYKTASTSTARKKKAKIFYRY